MTDTDERVGGGIDPDGADVRTAAVGGRTVSYAEYGAPDGVPVVLLHGTPGSRLLAGLFDGAARRRGVRLLAFDRPGYGRSSAWPDRTLADTGALVAAVLDDAGVSRAGAVGFSGGGPHALALAATRADLVRGVDVVAGAVPPSLGAASPPPLRLVEAMAGTTPRLLAGVLRALRPVAARAPPAVVVSQLTAPEARGELPDGVAELVAHDVVEALRTPNGFVTETRLLSREWDASPAAVDRRVRLWHGSRDTNVPADGARRVADRIPDAEVTVLDGADHLRTLLRAVPRALDRYGSTG